VSSTAPARVLVVDDHPLNLKLLGRLLALDGHQVLTADSLATAEQTIDECLPELIVLDLQLPDGDGLDLARKLKGDQATAGCPILACTARTIEGDEQSALAAGCDAYLRKPVDPERFAELTSALLSG
jgi:CheY-like chemotaxis protein